MRQFQEVNEMHKKHKEPAIIPTRKTEESAGYDIALPVDIHLKPKEARLFFTDIKCLIHPQREFLMIVIRSSLGIKGLSLMNAVGVIDSDYYNNEANDGNIGIPLINNSKDDIKIPAGNAIAQAIFMPYGITDCDVTQDVRKGGFGSTSSKE